MTGALALRALDRQVDCGMTERPVQPSTLDDELDPSTVGVEQPHGLVEGSLEDVAGVVDGRDPGGDRAERSLRLDPVLELLVEARVAEHDRGLARQRAEQLGGVLGEGVGARGVGADGADRSLLGDERRAHLGAIAGPGDPLVGADRMRERGVAQVVAGPDHAAIGDGLAGNSLADAHGHVVRGRHVRAGAEDRAVVGQLVRVGTDLVDDNVVGMQQPFRLVDRPQEHRRRVAQGCDGRRDLTQRALRLDLVGELAGRHLGLGVEPRIDEDDRRLVGEEAEQLGRVGVERGGLLRVDADRPDGSLRADQRCGDDGAQPELACHRIGRGVVREGVVGQVVIGHRGATLADGTARDPVVDLRMVFLREGHEPLVNQRVPIPPAQDAIGVGHDHPDLAAVALQQPNRLPECLDQHVRRVAEGRQLLGHHRQGSLCLHAVGELVGMAPQLHGQPRVGDRDCALVGEALQERQLVIGEPMRSLERDRQRAHHLALGTAERCGRHPPQREALGDPVIAGLVRNAWIDEVVLGGDHLVPPGGEAVDPVVDRELERVEPLLGPGRIAARDDRRAEESSARLHQRQVRAVRVDQPPGGFDDRLEDLGRFLDHRDAGRDLAERALRVDPASQLGLGDLEPLDQPLIGRPPRQRDRPARGAARAPDSSKSSIRLE